MGACRIEHPDTEHGPEMPHLVAPIGRYLPLRHLSLRHPKAYIDLEH
jgi:hypothetical protein